VRYQHLRSRHNSGTISLDYHSTAEWFTTYFCKTMFSVLSLLVCVCILRMVSSFSHYQLQIPNGQRVPSPCDRGEVWIGVGHLNPAGGGARNPFGRDFAKHDHVSVIFNIKKTIFNFFDIKVSITNFSVVHRILLLSAVSALK